MIKKEPTNYLKYVKRSLDYVLKGPTSRTSHPIIDSGEVLQKLSQEPKMQIQLAKEMFVLVSGHAGRIAMNLWNPSGPYSVRLYYPLACHPLLYNYYSKNNIMKNK